ncbi:hypothetical protein [Candidatus Williamhamiltonella defendens]|uniref:Uncharacterized protein n=1 Tax=Hamiltonella defensa subsp. Acyrthosiphon pisum (strain 5AT) TaxID=572265 RepID=C4K635_HAMD5|nr:hypothetical protein HDEF_1396 [Candidatus Hamiltonella defensa 5AT (Acyrthosiphon pisum)]
MSDDTVSISERIFRKETALSPHSIQHKNVPETRLFMNELRLSNP